MKRKPINQVCTSFTDRKLFRKMITYCVQNDIIIKELIIKAVTKFLEEGNNEKK